MERLVDGKSRSLWKASGRGAKPSVSQADIMHWYVGLAPNEPCCPDVSRYSLM